MNIDPNILKSTTIIDIASHTDDQNKINELANIIISRDCAEDIYYFAKKVKGSPNNILEDALIKLNDPYYAYTFARDIEGSNKNRLTDVVLNSYDVELACNFINDVPINKDTTVKFICFFIEEGYYETASSLYNKTNTSLDQIINIMPDGSLKQLIDFICKLNIETNEPAFKDVIDYIVINGNAYMARYLITKIGIADDRLIDVVIEYGSIVDIEIITESIGWEKLIEKITEYNDVYTIARFHDKAPEEYKDMLNPSVEFEGDTYRLTDLIEIVTKVHSYSNRCNDQTDLRVLLHRVLDACEIAEDLTDEKVIKKQNIDHAYLWG